MLGDSGLQCTLWRHLTKRNTPGCSSTAQMRANDLAGSADAHLEHLDLVSACAPTRIGSASRFHLLVRAGQRCSVKINFLHGLDSVTIADCDVFVFRRHHGKRPLLMSVSLLTTKSDTLFVDAELGITNPRWTTPTYQPTLFSYLASFGAIGSDSSIAHTAICLVHRVLISNLQDQQCRNVDHAHRRPLPSQHRYSQQI